MRQQLIVTCIFAYIVLAFRANANENEMKPDDTIGPIIMHHSLIPPFVTDWWEEGVPHWRFGGDAVVTNKFVRVVPNKPSRFGWAFNDQPNDNMDWELKVTFFIRSSKNNVADGLGIWLISNPPGPDDTDKSMGPLHGMRNDFRGIGVILDPYDNEGSKDTPLAALLTNMEGTNRDWDTDRDLRSTSVARCPFNYRTSDTVPAEMYLQYWKKKLTFTMYNPATNLRKECGVVEEIHFPMNTSFYLGLTATTGHVSGNHDITSFELRPLGKHIDDPTIPLKHFDHTNDDSDKTFWNNSESSGENYKRGGRHDEHRR